MLRRLIRYFCIFAAYMSAALNRSFALQHFKHGNMVKLCNGIMFDFYPALSHMYVGSTCLLYSLCPGCWIQCLITTNKNRNCCNRSLSFRTRTTVWQILFTGMHINSCLTIISINEHLLRRIQWCLILVDVLYKHAPLESDVIHNCTSHKTNY